MEMYLKSSSILCTLNIFYWSITLIKVEQLQKFLKEGEVEIGDSDERIGGWGKGDQKTKYVGKL